MGRPKKTKMIIKDVRVEAGRCIVAVEIRRGPHMWRKAYGFSAEQLKEGEFMVFQAAFKNRVLQDALQLEDDKKFEERVLLRLEDMKDTTIILD